MFAIGPGHAHQPAHGLRDDVIGRPVHIGAFAAARITEAADRGIDEGRIQFCQFLVAKSQPLHDARPEILDQHMGGAHEIADLGLRLLGLEVEDDAFLAAVQAHEIARPVALLVIGAPRAVAAAGVTLGAFDLDDLGTVVGEHHGAIGAGQHAAEIQHADAGEDAARRLSHLAPVRGRPAASR